MTATHTTTYVVITDQAGTSGTAVCTLDQVADTIRPWYVEAPAEIAQAIDDLQTAISRDDHAQHDLAECLAISITAAETLTAVLVEQVTDSGDAQIMIVDSEGDEIDRLVHDASEEWQPAVYDATLTGYGYVRVGDYDRSAEALLDAPVGNAVAVVSVVDAR